MMKVHKLVGFNYRELSLNYGICGTAMYHYMASTIVDGEVTCDQCMDILTDPNTYEYEYEAEDEKVLRDSRNKMLAIKKLTK